MPSTLKTSGQRQLKNEKFIKYSSNSVLDDVTGENVWCITIDNATVFSAHDGNKENK